MGWKEILKKLSDYETAVADEFATNEDMQKPPPVVGTRTMNINGKEVEYPVDEKGNVPYDVYQAALERQKELQEEIESEYAIFRERQAGGSSELTPGQQSFIHRTRRMSNQPPAPLGGESSYKEA